MFGGEIAVDGATFERAGIGTGIVKACGGGPEKLWDAYLAEAPDKDAGADGCEEYACSFVVGVGSVNRRGADGCDSGYS